MQDQKMVPSHIFFTFLPCLSKRMDSIQKNCSNGTLLDFTISICRCLVSSTSENNDENQESPRTQGSGLKANQASTYIDYAQKTTVI